MGRRIKDVTIIIILTHYMAQIHLLNIELHFKYEGSIRQLEI